MADIPELAAVPDVSLLGGLTLEEYSHRFIAGVEEKFYEKTGKRETLSRVNKYRMTAEAAALQLYQAQLHLERRFLAQLLKTSYGDDLDQLAATISHGHLLRNGVELLPDGTKLFGVAATVTVRFTLSALRGSAAPIPIGTRVRGEPDVFFFVKEYAEIPVGALFADAKCEAVERGADGNGFARGEIKTLVDPLPYIEKIENINTSQGGADKESDKDFTRRIYYSSERYSTAGALDAYKYWAMQYPGDIETVWPFTPAPCYVTVLVLLRGGVVPDETFFAGLYKWLSDKTIRPLGDRLTVAAPQEVPYEINLKYFIEQKFAASAVHIQKEAERAVDDYITWQRQITRDITPGMLYHALHSVPGIKRVAIKSPAADVVIDDRSIAKLTGRTVIYGGLEAE